MVSYYVTLLFYYLIITAIANVLVFKISDMYKLIKKDIKVLRFIAFYPIINFIFIIIVIIAYFKNPDEYDQ